MKYFLKYATHNDYEESVLQTTPQVSLCKKESHVNYKETKSLRKQYFTIESLEDDNVITLYRGSQSNSITIEVSVDDGNNWSSFTSAQNSWATLGILNKGQRMLFKGTNTRVNSSGSIDAAIRISTSKTCNLLGNLCSIINENTFETLTNSPDYNYCFAYLFAPLDVLNNDFSCKVVDASKLVLLEPSNTNGNYSYYRTFYNCSTLKFAPKSLGDNMKAHYLYTEMFKNCTSLIKGPELPSPIVYTQSYMELFSGCTSLETAPYIAATSLSSGGSAHFQGMFLNCTNLKNVQDELPIINLNNSTYYQMFMNCSSLTKAPNLSATTIPDSAYYCMFMNCISLVTGPTFTINALEGTSNNCTNMFYNCQNLTSVNCTINATTVLKNCYSAMFSNCYSLPEIPVKKLLATTPAESCYSTMFQNIGKNNSNFDGTKQVEICLTTLDKNCMYYMFAYAKVSNIKAAFTTTPSATYTNNWLYSVSPTGTFYKNSVATWNVRSATGVPNDWTIQTYTP